MTELQNIFPDDETLKFRDLAFKKIIDKISNLQETDEDGLDIDDLIAIGAAEDEDIDESEVSEAEEEILSEEQNQLVSQEDYKEFSSNELNQLKNAYKKRFAEAENLNLSLWKRSKTHETFNENNIKTKDFESSSRQFVRSTEEESGVNTSKALSPRSPFRFLHPSNQFPSFSFPNNQSFNISGIPASQNPQFYNFPQPPSVPGQQMFNVRVREFCYDYFSVTGNDISQLMQSYNRTLPNVSRAVEYLPTNQTIPEIKSNDQHSNVKQQEPIIKHKPSKNAVTSSPKKSNKEKKQSKNDFKLDQHVKKSSSKTNATQADSSSQESNLKENQKKTGTMKSEKKKVNDDQKITENSQNNDDHKMSYSDCVKLSMGRTLRSSKYLNDKIQIKSTNNKNSKEINISDEDAHNKKEQSNKNSKKNKKKKKKSKKAICDSDTSSEDLHLTLKKECPRKDDNENKNINKIPIDSNPSENKKPSKYLNNKKGIILPTIDEETPTPKIEISSDNGKNENKTSSKLNGTENKKLYNSENESSKCLPTAAEKNPISSQIKTKPASKNKNMSNKKDKPSTRDGVEETSKIKISSETEKDVKDRKKKISNKKTSNSRSGKNKQEIISKKQSENAENDVLLTNTMDKNMITRQITVVPLIEKLTLTEKDEKIVINDTDYDTSYDDLEYFREASRKFFDNAKKNAKT